MGAGGRARPIRTRVATEHDADAPAAESATRPADWLLQAQGSAGNAAVVRMLADRPAPAPLRRLSAAAFVTENEVARVADGTIQRRRKKKKPEAPAAKAAAPASTTPATTTPATAPATTAPTTAPATTATAQTAVPATTATVPATPAPATVERDPDVVALEAVIGVRPVANMIAHFGDQDTVLDYADDVGHQRLKWLIETKRLTAAVLDHYGAEMLKDFVGAGETSWTHLVTAGTNSKGAISGAHDEDVFYEYLESIDYQVVGQPRTSEVYKVTYANAAGTTKGSKSLIQGLAGKKSTWQGYFNQAIWNAIRDKTFAPGTSYPQADGWSYGVYYRAGATEVDTVYPA